MQFGRFLSGSVAGLKSTRFFGPLIALPFLCLGMLHAQCALTGSYNLGPGNDGNQATGSGSGPFHLTATNSTFSYVDFVPDQTFTFSQISSLAANFVSNSGGSGGGTPRLVVNLANNGAVVIYLGNSPNFTDTDAVLNTWSGVNLIGNNDAGRYDLSFAVPVGSPSTTYSAALAAQGSQTVTDIAYVTDTFGAFPSRDETFNGFSGSTAGVCKTTPAQFLSSSWWYWYVI
jgi:hypothetical protein